ncbi:MAG: ring-cleaving dioxygenase [Chloroflexota bacterium]
MEKQLSGIHHITAMAGDPQANVDFYAGLLGLRMVKVTVNFDDPGTYHFYYGDEEGNPGTILTFFPWPGAHRGRRGTGQATATAFSIPAGSLLFWMQRLQDAGVEMEGPVERFGEQVITFYDPDNLQLEMVAHRGADARPGWAGGTVPAEHAIRGFHGVTLAEQNQGHTAQLLESIMGFRLVGQEENRWRYESGDGGPGTLVDVLHLPDVKRGVVAVGTVHHVAWRAPSDEQQEAWQAELESIGADVTPIIDRQYFHSVYFHEPGGVLFEIATDPPGFAIDETVENLGHDLKLPPQYESLRPKLEKRLIPLQIPGVGQVPPQRVGTLS